MKSINNQRADNKAAKKMFYILIIGIIPLLLIFFIYMNNQDSDMLNYINIISGEFPELSSANSPLLSSVMSFYVKTAPLYGVVFFIRSYKFLKLDESSSPIKLMVTFLIFSFFYIVILFFLLAYNIELTESGRLFRFLSGGDYLLTIFFISVFYTCYTLTCYYLSFIYATYMILKIKIFNR